MNAIATERNQALTPPVSNPFGSLSLPEVGARWALPSDHLPIGARIGESTVASWNVLNTAYLHYIRENAQGLADSIIIDDNHKLSPDESLTVREAKVLEIVASILTKVDLVFLQECSPLVVEELTNRRPDGWIIATGHSTSSTNEICALFNGARITLDKAHSDIVEHGFVRCRALTPGLERPIMNLLFTTHSGERLRVIHTHAPGHPEHPAIEELAEYVEPYLTNPQVPTAIVGDLNFPEELIRNVFTRRSLPPFTNLVQMNTHIGTDGLPKQIDHILYVGPPGIAQPLQPDTFGPETASTANLINP